MPNPSGRNKPSAKRAKAAPTPAAPVAPTREYDPNDRTTWSGADWTQHAALLASRAVDESIQVMADIVRSGAERNASVQLQAADRILQLAGLIERRSDKAQVKLPPASNVLDWAKLSEALRLQKQKERRGE